MNPDLVARDDQGKPYSVRYEAVNAMLLNEFLKEHRKVTEQETTIKQLKAELQATATRQQKQIDALTAGLQKVNAQLELSRAAPQNRSQQSVMPPRGSHSLKSPARSCFSITLLRVKRTTLLFFDYPLTIHDQ